MNVEHGNIMKVEPEHQMNHVNKGESVMTSLALSINFA